MIGTLANVILGLYDRGLLGGRPRRLLNLQEDVTRLGLGEAQRKGALMEQPMWTEGRKPAPGEGVVTGGIIPPDYKEGPSYREAQAYFDMLQKSGLDKLLQSQAPGQLLKSLGLEQLLGPVGAEKALSEGITVPQPSPEKRKALDYGEAVGKSLQDIGPDVIDAIWGLTEPERAGSFGGGGLAYTQGRRAGEIIKEGTGTQGAAEIQEWRAWQQDPPPEYVKTGKTAFHNFQEWKATLKAKTALNPQKDHEKKAFDAAKVALQAEVENQWLSTAEPPKAEELLGRFMELYQDALEQFKTGKPAEGSEIDKIRNSKAIQDYLKSQGK